MSEMEPENIRKIAAYDDLKVSAEELGFDIICRKCGSIEIELSGCEDGCIIFKCKGCGNEYLL